MKYFWTHLLHNPRWRYATPAKRRELEIRYCLGRRLRQKRRQLKLTQKQLADLIHAAQPTISKIERGSPRVSMDMFVRAMIAMNATDVEIAAAFHAQGDLTIQKLRLRVARQPGWSAHGNILDRSDKYTRRLKPLSNQTAAPGIVPPA